MAPTLLDHVGVHEFKVQWKLGEQIEQKTVKLEVLCDANEVPTLMCHSNLIPEQLLNVKY